MSSATTPAPQPAYRRHALGLPAGSVRALLAFAVLGLSWALVLKAAAANQKLGLDFLYMQMLMLLMLAHFFAAHGNSIGPQVSPRSPLGLPRGSVRFLLIAGYGGLAYYMYHNKTEYDIQQTDAAAAGFTLALLLGGFFLGHLLTGLVRSLSGGTLPYWFQDVQAWVALLAMIGLAVVAVVHVFINPGQPPGEELKMHKTEATLAAIVGFYFGSR